MQNKEISLFGLVGGSCSGKTTLRKNILQNYGALVESVNLDDFVKPIKPQLWNTIDDWENPALYDFDSLSNCLDSLLRGKTTRWKSYSWESYQTGKFDRVMRPKRIVLVEGFLSCFDRRIKDKFDKVVFLDLPEEEIVARRLQRGEQGVNLCDISYIEKFLLPSHRQYVLPQKKFAHIVLDGRDEPEILTTQLAKILGLI